MAHLITTDRPDDYSHHQTDATRRAPFLRCRLLLGKLTSIDPAIQVRVTYLQAVPRWSPGQQKTHRKGTLFVVHDRALDDELTITSPRHTVAEHVTTAGPVRTVGGIAGTRRPGAAPWEKFQDSAPAGDWELQLEDTPIVRKLFADGVIQDMVVVFTLSGTTPRRI